MKKRTGGTWNPQEEKIVFHVLGGRTESDGYNSQHRKNVYSLCSTRDLSETTYCEELQGKIGAYKGILLDSGIFGLAMDYAKAAGINHNAALTTPLEHIPGWFAFRDRYVDMARRVGQELWGYVELDLGGTAQKIETRTWLENIGLAPIPVWHPLNDGMDYGIELMTQYDRICVGNIVKSDTTTRKAVLEALAYATRHDLKCWVHALGLGPADYVISYPVNSIDAVSWLGSVIWKYRAGYSLFHPFIKKERYYDESIEGSDRFVAVLMLELQALSAEANWRGYERAKVAIHTARPNSLNQDPG